MDDAAIDDRALSEININGADSNGRNCACNLESLPIRSKRGTKSADYIPAWVCADRYHYGKRARGNFQPAGKCNPIAGSISAWSQSLLDESRRAIECDGIGCRTAIDRRNPADDASYRCANPISCLREVLRIKEKILNAAIPLIACYLRPGIHGATGNLYDARNHVL